MNGRLSITVDSPPAHANPAPEIARLRSLRPVKAAFEWFASHTFELSERQMELTRIPAPPFGESHRAEWFRTRFLELGLEEAHIDEAGNVLGISPGTVAGSKFVALSAHLDTVFPQGAPINIRREGNRLAGPGISDNGAGLTALLGLATVLQTLEIRHAAPVLFIANVGEEGEGDLRGMRHIFNDARWQQAIGYTLVIDGGGTDTIITEGLGSRRFLATVHGPGGHSWTDFGVPNPIVLLARAVHLFAQTPVPKEPKTAFNIGVISGGTSVNSIPESAAMKVDVRSASALELQRMEQALRQALEEATADFSFRVPRFPETGVTAGAVLEKGPAKTDSNFELKLIGNRPAAELHPSAHILQVIKAVDAELGIKSRQQRASTDANVPLSLGREAVAIGGGGIGGGAHTMQEWYDPANRELALSRILLTALALAAP